MLICSVNWIGDTLMALPAVQLLRARYPDRQLVVLARPNVVPIWRMSPTADQVWPYPLGLSPILRAARRVRESRISTAYVLPHSIRSALPVVLAGVPERVGLPGPLRRFLMTRIVYPHLSPHRQHQTFEYLDLLAPWASKTPPPSPILTVPPEARVNAIRLLGDNATPWIGLLPGAARGPAKRWPAERFAEVGRRLASDRLGRVAVFGAASEKKLCERVAAACGPNAISMAGQGGIEDWAAMLARCRIVIANDSGGMHLAAALGVPVVAVFGATDPMRTAPLSNRVRCVRATGVSGSRDIARDDARARAALETVSTDMVYGAARDLLEVSERSPFHFPLSS